MNFPQRSDIEKPRFQVLHQKDFFFLTKASIIFFSLQFLFPIRGNKTREASTAKLELPLVLMNCLLLMCCHSSQALEVLRMWSKGEIAEAVEMNDSVLGTCWVFF